MQWAKWLNSFKTKSKNMLNKKSITFDEFLNEKKKEKNPYAICTASIAKEAGTSKRSEWTKKQKQKYDECIEKVKNKN